MSDLYKVVVSVKIVNADGSAVEGPTNELHDVTMNLNQDQAKASLYAAKALLGGVYQAALKEILDGNDPEVIKAAAV